MSNNHASGPFGNYDRHCPGHVLNNLCHLGIPLQIVSSLTVSKDSINYSGKRFAVYKYFEGIDQPLFHFDDHHYQTMLNHDGNYVLSLGVHGNPSLVLTGGYHADKVAWETINRGLTNYMLDPFYKLKNESGAFFQGGSQWIDNTEGFLYVEFWKPSGAQAWVDAFNEALKKHRLEKETLPEL